MDMEERVNSTGQQKANPFRPKENGKTKSVHQVIEYKKRVLHTAVFYFGFFVFGWVVGQMGAAFLDLLLLTGTDLALGSLLFTLAGLASIAGGLVGGFLLDWSGRPLLMMAGVFALNAAVNSTLALCRSLALMAALYFLSHFALSVYDVAVNPHLASIWPDSSSGGFLQGLHFVFSVGAVLSPLATQPFLAPRTKDTHLIPVRQIEQEFVERGDDLHVVYVNDTYNSSSDIVTGLPEEEPARMEETRVFYALLISGCLCVVAVVLMMILMMIPVQKLKRRETREEEGQLPAKALKIYYTALVMLGVYNFLGSSVEDVFPLYLMTFVVRELDWSKRAGAHVTSVYWVGLSVGRLCGVGLVKLLSPTRIILGCLVSMITSLLVLLVAAILRAHWAVWVAAGAVGLSTSVLFPTGLIYTHHNVARLTGKVSAIIFTTPMMAAMGNPLLLATLMTRFHNRWYVHLFLLQTFLAFLCFLLLHALSRQLNRHRHSGSPHDGGEVFAEGVEMAEKESKDREMDEAQSFLDCSEI